MLAIAFVTLSQNPTHEWTRRPMPGVEYRMIVEENPARLIHGLRFAPDAPVYATSSLANDEVYDRTPTNGRRTLSQAEIRSG